MTRGSGTDFYRYRNYSCYVIKKRRNTRRQMQSSKTADLPYYTHYLRNCRQKIPKEKTEYFMLLSVMKSAVPMIH